jgi:outer membrane protein assembly factor BamB
MGKNMVQRLTTVILLLSLTACSWVEDILTEDVYEAPPAELTEFVMEMTPSVKWDTSAGDGAEETGNRLGLWLQEGLLVNVDAEGEVYALNAENGKRVWDQDLDAPIITGAGGGEQLIIVGTQRGQVQAFSASQGQKKWRAKLTSEVLARPIVSQGFAIVRTADGRITGLSAETGEVLWSYQRSVPLLSLRGAGAPVVSEGKVIVGYDSGKLVALSLFDGKVLWEKNVAVPRGRTELERLVDIDADPVVIDGTVYVVSYQGNAAAVNLMSGDVLWRRDMSSQIGLDAVVNDGVYITDEDGYVWAIQDGSGDALWRQTRLLRRQVTAPAVIGSYLVVGDLEGYLHFIARDDGRFVSRIQVSDAAIRSKPIVSGNTVYVNTIHGDVVAIQVPVN